MSILAISHNIYLTEKQRYDLHDRKSISTIGISYPVWYHNRKTSGKNPEIYLKYELTNSFNEDCRIRIVNNIYYLNLPQNVNSTESIKINENEFIPCDPLNSKKLLNFKDDGLGALSFMIEDWFKINGKLYKAMHFVDIKDRSYFFDNCLTMQKLGFEIPGRQS